VQSLRGSSRPLDQEEGGVARIVIHVAPAWGPGRCRRCCCRACGATMDYTGEAPIR